VPDDPGLIARSWKLDGVRPPIGPDVVHASEIIGVLVQRVDRASRQTGRPQR